MCPLRGGGRLIEKSILNFHFFSEPFSRDDLVQVRVVMAMISTLHIAKVIKDSELNVILVKNLDE